MKGRKGLQYAMKPNILDALMLVSAAWSEISEQTIKNCWTKSKCIGAAIELSSDLALLEEHNQQDLQNLDDAMRALQIVGLQSNDAQVQDHLGTLTGVELTDDDIVQIGREWATFEDSADMIAAVHEEILSATAEMAVTHITENNPQVTQSPSPMCVHDIECVLEAIQGLVAGRPEDPELVCIIRQLRDKLMLYTVEDQTESNLDGLDDPDD